MSGHGGKIKFTLEEITLIVAALEMMGRLTRDDTSLKQSEKEKVYAVADDIKRKFHNAYFHDPRMVIVDPDGFVAH